MISAAKMTKQVPGTGVISQTTPDLFRRHEFKSKFKGIASFGPRQDVSVLLEVADSPFKKAKGLMGRTSLPSCCGMLFTDLDGGAFWMKGCKIPLDIVFINDDNIITLIYTMEPDGGKKRYFYDDETSAIELQAGFCKKHGIEPGSKCTWRTW